MSYVVQITPAAHKMLKKLPPQIRKQIVEEAQKLHDQPYLGQQLRGEFQQFYSLHIKFNNVQYRVGYEIHESLQEILIRAVGVRENFYRKLEEMKIKPFR
jgi:mRNA-degrading endonuclease RelE of RelBE toxin-antitoxin system